MDTGLLFVSSFRILIKLSQCQQSCLIGRTQPRHTIANSTFKRRYFVIRDRIRTKKSLKAHFFSLLACSINQESSRHRWTLLLSPFCLHIYWVLRCSRVVLPRFSNKSCCRIININKSKSHNLPKKHFDS